MSRDLKKMREEVLWLSGGRLFRAVETACVKVLSEVGLCGSVRKAAERPVGQEWRALEESRHGGQAVCAWPWLWH